MPTNVGRLNVLIGADLTGLDAALKKAQTGINKFSGKLDTLGRGLTKAVTLPLLGIGAASIKMASDAEESASKFQAVFGSAAGEVNGWLQQLRKTIPATTAELQGMTAEIQDLLGPLGLAPAAAKDMTKQVVQLAGDLASFNNIPMAEALERIRSGLVGQNEPLLKFGVALNAAMVEARALQMGLIQQGEALTPAARAQAAFALILERTTAAQGDAARTADSAANQFKIFTAEVKELGITIGQRLLPIVTPMVGKLTDALRGVQSLSPEVKQLGINFGIFIGILGPGLIVISKLSALIAATNPYILLSVAAVAAAIVVWRQWSEEIKGFLGFIGKAFGVIKKFAELIDPITARSAQSITDKFTGAASKVRESFGSMFGGVKETFDGIEAAVAAAGAAVDTQLAAPLVQATVAAQGLTAAQMELLNSTNNVVPALAGINNAVGQVPILAENAKTFLTRMAIESKDELKALKDTATDVASSGLDAFTSWAVGAGGSFKDFARTAIQQLTKVLVKMLAIKAVGLLIPGAGGILGGLFGGFFAEGGKLQPGQFGVVGERGPELVFAGAAGATIEPMGGAMSLSVDTSGLPPYPRAVTPDALAVDDYWRRAFAAQVVDHKSRGGRF